MSDNSLDDDLLPTPQDEINTLLQVIEKNKDALAEMQEEVRTFRDALEEQEKLNSDLKMERNSLDDRVKELEAQLVEANEKLSAFEAAPIQIQQDQPTPPSAPDETPLKSSKLIPPITVPTRQDRSSSDGDAEYPLLIPTPSGNNATVLVDGAQLEQMKKDMLKQMQELTRDEVARMIDHQDSLRWATAVAATKSRDEKPVEDNPVIVVDEHITEEESALEIPLTQARPEVDLNETTQPPPNGGLHMLHPERSKDQRKKNLYRSGSYTEWSPEMLEGLKSEMMESLREMRREELSKMLSSQDQLRWGAESKDMDSDVASIASELEHDERQDKRIRGKNLLRNGSKWDWTDMDVDALKTEMYEELTRIHKKELADMIASQEAIRYPSEATGQEDDSLAREVSSQRKQILSQLSAHEMKQMHDAIVEEMTHITKRELSSMMEKQMQLRWNEVTSGTATPNLPANRQQRLPKPIASISAPPRDSENNLFRQGSRERWDIGNLQRMEEEMSKQIAQMQHTELQRRFETNADHLWPSSNNNDDTAEEKSSAAVSSGSDQRPVVHHAVQTSRTHIVVDEQDLLLDGGMEPTPGGPDDDLSGLNYVAPVTNESYSESNHQPAWAEKKSNFVDDDEDDGLLPGKPTPGATVAMLPPPEEYITPGGPDDETPGGDDDMDTPLGPPIEPQIVIKVVPLVDHPDFAEYKTQSENTIRGLKQEMAALAESHEEELQEFQESKMQLILSTSAEMDSLRQMIRKMAENFRELQTQAAFLRS